MSNDLSYFTAKLAEAVQVLATHPGALRQRLQAALEEVPGIAACSRTDLPEPLRPMFAATIGRLMQPDATGTVDPRREAGTMSEAEACELARQLCTLLGECRSAL